MTSFITKAALAPVAASFALMLAISAPASAQSQLTNGPDGMQPNTLRNKPHTARRPLTVRRAGAPVVAAAPVVAGSRRQPGLGRSRRRLHRRRPALPGPRRHLPGRHRRS